MNTELVRLTLVYPRDTEDKLVEVLLSHRPTLPGFTSWGAEGHGHGFERASLPEQVRGRVRRGTLTMVLSPDAAQTVLEALRAEVQNRDVVWWLEPVLAWGRLA